MVLTGVLEILRFRNTSYLTKISVDFQLPVSALSGTLSLVQVKRWHPLPYSCMANADRCILMRIDYKCATICIQLILVVLDGHCKCKRLIEFECTCGVDTFCNRTVRHHFHLSASPCCWHGNGHWKTKHTFFLVSKKWIAKFLIQKYNYVVWFCGQKLTIVVCLRRGSGVFIKGKKTHGYLASPVKIVCVAVWSTRTREEPVPYVYSVCLCV